VHQALFVHAIVVVPVIVLIATKVSAVVVGARGALFEFQGELTAPPQVMSLFPPSRRLGVGGGRGGGGADEEGGHGEVHFCCS
jgi:hypothetical protein